MQSDRFAREIGAILALSYAARSRQLNAKPLGGSITPISSLPPVARSGVASLLAAL
jgi:hypothetical protein